METRKSLNQTNQTKVRAMFAWCAPVFVAHWVTLNSEYVEVKRKDGNIKITTNQLVYDSLPEKLIRAGMPVNITLTGQDLNGITYEIYKQWKVWSKNHSPILSKVKVLNKTKK